MHAGETVQCQGSRVRPPPRLFPPGDQKTGKQKKCQSSLRKDDGSHRALLGFIVLEKCISLAGSLSTALRSTPMYCVQCSTERNLFRGKTNGPLLSTHASVLSRCTIRHIRTGCRQMSETFNFCDHRKTASLATLCVPRPSLLLGKFETSHFCQSLCGLGCSLEVPAAF